MIDQIKNLPESRLSFQQGFYDFFMGWHTGITNHERVVANLFKGGVNKIIDAVYAVVQDESLRTVPGNIGTCKGTGGQRATNKSINPLQTPPPTNLSTRLDRSCPAAPDCQHGYGDITTCLRRGASMPIPGMGVPLCARSLSVTLTPHVASIYHGGNAECVWERPVPLDA